MDAYLVAKREVENCIVKSYLNNEVKIIDLNLFKIEIVRGDVNHAVILLQG